MSPLLIRYDPDDRVLRSVDDRPGIVGFAEPGYEAAIVVDPTTQSLDLIDGVLDEQVRRGTPTMVNATTPTGVPDGAHRLGVAETLNAMPDHADRRALCVAATQAASYYAAKWIAEMQPERARTWLDLLADVRDEMIARGELRMTRVDPDDG